MIDYQPLYDILLEVKAEAWVKLLPKQLASAFAVDRHGNLEQWLNVIKNMKQLSTSHRLLDADAIQIGLSDEVSEVDSIELRVFAKEFTSLA